MRRALVATASRLGAAISNQVLIYHAQRVAIRLYRVDILASASAATVANQMLRSITESVHNPAVGTIQLAVTNAQNRVIPMKLAGFAEHPATFVASTPRARRGARSLVHHVLSRNVHPPARISDALCPVQCPATGCHAQRDAT